MENENKSNQDCGCGSDCCPPKKNKLWMKLVFIAIVVAAVGIVTVKLISSNTSDSTEKSSCCDTTKSKGCCEKENHSCSSQTKDSMEVTKKTCCDKDAKTKNCEPEKKSPGCSAPNVSSTNSKKHSCCDSTKKSINEDKQPCCSKNK